ncbi:MAG TPA: hypothetical protein VI488_03490 [Candidatus Angelobacter sp.]
MSLLILLLVSISSLFVPDPATAGVKIVTRQVSGGFSDTRTEYLTANRLRSEWQTHVGELTGPPMASIVQRGATSRVFLMDLQAHEYVTYETDSQGSALGTKPRTFASSGGVLEIWIDNTDTGERLLMFGHMARHIITREKRIASPGACSRSSESESDGWYIDDSVMPEWNRQRKPGGGVVVASMVAVSSVSACFDRMDTIQVHRTGVEPGFPLKITTTMKSEVPSLDGGARLVASNWGSEVMEFKEGPLDPSLFDVPVDFHKVDALKNWSAPAPRRQLTGWEWFKEKLSQIFQ